ncbi:hypothetical protein ACVRWL_01375 [Streptococcus ratti]|uniref:Uncharacterized protein n=1 Tax=Streptococcus ratti TaxID=1341 RepID=A0A7X9LDW8_STRRT|nr:hypothetical protein [Streptococcus ratti]NMD49157.1 hypothetical protein [Streptococcus ratti]
MTIVGPSVCDWLIDINGMQFFDKVITARCKSYYYDDSGNRVAYLESTEIIGEKRELIQEKQRFN